MKKNMIIALALLGAQLAVAVPAQAAFVFEGLKPVELPECVKKGEQPYADEAQYRQDSDTRPECRHVAPSPKPAEKPESEKVPQK